jgi:hypothetical protein
MMPAIKNGCVFVALPMLENTSETKPKNIFPRVKEFGTHAKFIFMYVVPLQ